ncbi:hypothetical protein HZS_1753, partial [Henneguya salminicola]
MQNLSVYGRYKLRAPYEHFRIKYRKGNHILELTAFRIKNIINKFNAFFESDEVEDINVEEIDDLIIVLGEYIQKLKRIESVLISYCEGMEQRIDLFKPLSTLGNNINVNSDNVLKIFTQIYHNYLACELLDRGYIKTARLYISKNQLENLIEIELFLYNRMVEIELELEHGNIEACIRWCKEQKTNLKTSTSLFFLKIRIYEFSQMIKNHKINEAYQYALRYFSAPSEIGQKLVEEAICLLACTNHNSDAFSSFFSSHTLEELISDFRKEYKTINGLNNGTSDFCAIIHYGLMAVRTRSCDIKDFNVNCPSCNELFREIANSLPFPSRPASFVKCRLSNKFYGSDQDLFATPQGFVYSSEGINSNLKYPSNAFRCPQT